MTKAEAIARVAAGLKSKMTFTLAEFILALQALPEAKQARLVALLASSTREAVWKILSDLANDVKVNKAKAVARDIVTNQGITLENLDKVL